MTKRERLKAKEAKHKARLAAVHERALSGQVPPRKSNKSALYEGYGGGMKTTLNR